VCSLSQVDFAFEVGVAQKGGEKLYLFTLEMNLESKTGGR
jgi:hypothetical protein